MCGRFYFPTEEEDEDIKKIIAEINEKYKNTSLLSEMKRGEIFPTDIVPVIADKSPLLMKWGFHLDHSKSHIINARLETASEKPMFRHSFLKQRCLIPAFCYFEWEKRGSQKQKYSIGIGETLYMAGLYRVPKDRTIPEFVILTRPAIREIGHIHDRMPVILPKKMHQAWFNERLDANVILDYPMNQIHYERIK